MSIASTLLKRLAGISSPGGPTAHKQVGAGPAVDFASMLAKVEQGQASSGLTVTAARTLGTELSAAEVTALSRAADLAEARGATTAAVRMQDKMYTVDVGVRQVIDVRPVGSEPMVGIDALIDLDAPNAALAATTQAVPGSDPLSTRHGLNQSLRTILASLDSAA
jgi:hypothetical protein